MRITLVLCILFGAASLAAMCSAAGEGPGGDAPRRATALRVHEPGYGAPEVVVEKSMPPRFELVFQREMPTPGYGFTIERTAVDEAERRITVDVTERAPGGMTAQVITRTTLRCPLGRLAPGAWFFELRSRRGPDATFAPAVALVLVAH